MKARLMFLFIGFFLGAWLTYLADGWIGPRCVQPQHTWGKWQDSGRIRAWNSAHIKERACETCGWTETRDE